MTTLEWFSLMRISENPKGFIPWSHRGFGVLFSLMRISENPKDEEDIEDEDAT